MIILAVITMGLILLMTLVAAVLTLSGVADLGSPWDRMFPFFIFMVLLVATTVERYRRKKLEERVAALEAKV